jgi:glycosyltransferase involved in cell wall biosynthesis
MIIGDGHLYKQVRKYISDNKLENVVVLLDWIPDDKLPEYYNELKLLVIPSYINGLPYSMLEAMACGKLILATPVGVIPDVIKEGITSFIVQENAPQGITKNILTILENNSLA